MDAAQYIEAAAQEVTRNRARLALRLHGIAVALAAWDTEDGRRRPEFAIERLRRLAATFEQWSELISTLDAWEDIPLPSVARLAADLRPKMSDLDCRAYLLSGIRAAIHTAQQSRTLGLAHVHIENLKRRTRTQLNSLSRTTGRIFVCSDVHLGTAESGQSALLEVMSLCNRGDTLVLLGDILDAWFADDDARTLSIIEQQWTWLHACISALKTQGVAVHYVPSNHDSFVFTLTAAPQSPFCRKLVSQNVFLDSLQPLAQSYDFAAVATVDYPFLRFDRDGGIMLTHGHLGEWYWAWMGSHSEDLRSPALIRDQQSTLARLMAVASSVAYQHRRKFRTAFKIQATGLDVFRRQTDICALITMEVFEAYTAAGWSPTQKWDGFIDRVDATCRLIAAGQGDAELKAISARVQAGIEQLDEWYTARDLSRIRKDVEKFIDEYGGQVNYAMHRSQQVLKLGMTGFSTFRQFKHLMFGHFHKPTEQGAQANGLTIDDGALLHRSAVIVSAFQIDPDGTITPVLGLTAKIDAN